MNYQDYDLGVQGGISKVTTDLARYISPGDGLILARRGPDLRIIQRASRLEGGWRDITPLIAEHTARKRDARGNLRASDSVTILGILYHECPGLRSIAIHDMEQMPAQRPPQMPAARPVQVAKQPVRTTLADVENMTPDELVVYIRNNPHLIQPSKSKE